MRKIIIITALCVCTIGIVLIVNKPNMQKIYSSPSSTEYNLQKKSISSNNLKSYTNIAPQYKIESKNIQINHQYKQSKLTTATKNTKLLNVRSNRNNSNMSQSNNNVLAMNWAQPNFSKVPNQSIGIERFTKVDNINSSINNNLLKTDVYIPMQFAFPDEGQLSNPGATPLNNELVLLVLACIFIWYKK